MSGQVATLLQNYKIPKISAAKKPTATITNQPIVETENVVAEQSTVPITNEDLETTLTVTSSTRPSPTNKGTPINSTNKETNDIPEVELTNDLYQNVMNITKNIEILQTK